MSAETESLKKILSKERGGDKKFEEIISALISFNESKKRGVFNPTKLRKGVWVHRKTLYLCHFPSQKCKEDLDKQLKITLKKIKHLSKSQRLTKLVICTPESVPCSSSPVGSECTNCVKELKSVFSKNIEITHLDETYIKDFLISKNKILGLRFLPKLLPNGEIQQKKIKEKQKQYIKQFLKTNKNIQFVGMSVYKEETSSNIEMDKIYIPLKVMNYEGTEDKEKAKLNNPLSLLSLGSRNVILGDPGCGKSTLLKFLALSGIHVKLRKKYNTKQDNRLPILIVLRQYANELAKNSRLSIKDYILRTANNELLIHDIQKSFFEYFLLAGQAVILFDGLDELPSYEIKELVDRKINNFLHKYSGNTFLISSRIVGYEKKNFFEMLGFSHKIVAQLSDDDIRNFVNDWYSARIEPQVEKKRHSDDLVRIIMDPESGAIRDLSRNPLLLTIICLVHRIDAVLPDERVVLYEKCTETLLNTWHTWKFRDDKIENRNKLERRNRARMEAIAHWMHILSPKEKVRQTIVKHNDLRDFLAEYIRRIEKPKDKDIKEMAEVFLRFVKERAGLLVEVGEKLYSFVHLTFQEYLTATFLRKSGEKGGIKIVWNSINDHLSDSRWHEVIRLLIASLVLTDSQRFIIEKIMPNSTDEDYVERALLIAGFLNDSVDAAEEMECEIIDCVLRASILTKKKENLKSLLRFLANWKNKNPEQLSILLEISEDLMKKLRSRMNKAQLSLNLLSLGIKERMLRTLKSPLFDSKTKEGLVFKMSIQTQFVQKIPSIPSAKEKYLKDKLNSLFYKSVEFPYVPITLSALIPLNNIGDSCPSFEQFLLFIYGNFARNYRRRGIFVNRSDFLFMKKSQEAFPNIYREIFVNEKINRKELFFFPRTLSDIKYININRMSYYYPENIYASIRYLSGDEKFKTTVFDHFFKLMKMDQSVQWYEAFRLSLSKKIVNKISIFQEKVFYDIINKLESGKESDSFLYNVATLLLIYLWIKIQYHESTDFHPFTKLIKLTKTINNPLISTFYFINEVYFDKKIRKNQKFRMIIEKCDEILLHISPSLFLRQITRGST